MFNFIGRFITKSNSIDSESLNDQLVKQYRPKRNQLSTQLDLNINERILCVLKGCALGDYAGQPFEFMPPMDCDIVADYLYLGSRGYTDDTILTCATASVVRKIVNGGIGASDEPGKGNADMYADAYRSYATDYPVVLGGYGSRFLSWVHTNKNYFSCGNGSSMRVSPCGCFNDVETVILQAYNSAICTHSHPEGIKGAIVTAVCIWMAFHGYSKAEIASYTDHHYPNSPYSPKISFTKMESYKYFKGNPAVCQSSVPLAVSCFVNSENYEDCIVKAIRFGWDTDTNAAIAGSIAAAYYRAFNELSEKTWREKIAGVDGAVQRELAQC